MWDKSQQMHMRGGGEPGNFLPDRVAFIDRPGQQNVQSVAYFRGKQLVCADKLRLIFSIANTSGTDTKQCVRRKPVFLPQSRQIGGGMHRDAV